MPSLKKIAAHLGVIGDPPHCWKCKALVPTDNWDKASRWLERAHVIDRVFDGLDNAANLRPLCPGCHRVQPIFRAGEEARALRWFNKPGDPMMPFLVTVMGMYADIAPLRSDEPHRQLRMWFVEAS
jgi:hypothetical protein